MYGGERIFQSISYVIYRKYFKFLDFVECEISNNFKEAKIEPRPTNGNGVWCCTLLPVILMTYTFLYNVSPLYYLIAYTSLGLLCYSILFVIFMSISCLVLTHQLFGGCIASTLANTILLNVFLNKDLTFSLLFSFVSVYTYGTLLKLALLKFPKTFTLGEAMLVIQSIVLYGCLSLSKLLQVSGELDADMDFISAVVITVSSTVGIIVTALAVMTDKHKDLHYFGYVLASALLYTLVVLHSTLGVTCLFQIANFIFKNQRRITLMIFWMILVAMTVMILLIRSHFKEKATTVTRKTFHILASFVFVSGILYDIYLMTLAAGLGLWVLVFIEGLRKTNIEPFSSALQKIFEIYKDEKDSGSFALTPIYMYCGLACPMILVPTHEASHLELLSGVLAVGVGDTAASWFGSRYGMFKWAGSKKTVEGTAFNVGMQITVVYILQLLHLIEAENALVRIAFAAMVSGITEGMTDQVDNLVLPLVTIIALQATYPFS